MQRGFTSGNNLSTHTGASMTCRRAINQAELQSQLPKRFIWHGASQKAACINYLKNYQGKKIEVNITEYIPEHSDSQRGYFHMCCKIMGDALGYTLEDIKRLVKRELWGTEIHTIAGREIEIYKSMAKGSANKLDYSDAIETLLRLAAEADVYLPEPQ